MKKHNIILRCPHCNKKIIYDLDQNKIIDIEKNKTIKLQDVLELQKKKEENLDIFNEIKNYENKKELGEKKFFSNLKNLND